jgi:hypothetical protein
MIFRAEACPMTFPRPSEDNAFLADHVALMRSSFRHWTGRDLLDPRLTGSDAARAAFTAPFVLVSHDTSGDPVFNYGNATALALFGFSWEEFTALPSRFSAEPLSREERAVSLSRVKTQGYIDDYCGIRIARGGSRFRIEQATVWNLIDPWCVLWGQAAMFRHWVFLPEAGESGDPSADTVGRA